MGRRTADQKMRKESTHEQQHKNSLTFSSVTHSKWGPCDLQPLDTVITEAIHCPGRYSCMSVINLQVL